MELCFKGKVRLIIFGTMKQERMQGSKGVPLHNLNNLLKSVAFLYFYIRLS